MYLPPLPLSQWSGETNLPGLRRLKTLANRLLAKRLVGETSINRYKGGNLSYYLQLQKTWLFFAWLLMGRLPGFYLGFIIWRRSPEWPKATRFLGGPVTCCPGNFLKWICTEMQSGAFWDTILRNVTVCALTSSRLDDFFWYRYLYTVMIEIFFGGRGESWAFFGGGGASTLQIP